MEKKNDNPNNLSNHKNRLSALLRNEQMFRQTKYQDNLLLAVESIYDNPSADDIERKIVYALVDRDRYNEIITNKYPGYECHLMKNIVSRIPKKYTVSGAFAIVAALILYGKNVVHPQDKEVVSTIMDSMNPKCLEWICVATFKGKSIGVRQYYSKWNDFILQTVIHGYNLQLQSILELAAFTDSYQLFAKILENNKHFPCKAEWLMSVLVHSGSIRCLKYFIESNPWGVDFSNFDFSYFFAVAGHVSASNRRDNKEYKSCLLEGWSDKGTKDLLRGELICVQYLADKFLKPGWEHRYPIGLDEDKDRAVDLLIFINCTESHEHLLSCIDNGVLEKKHINEILDFVVDSEESGTDFNKVYDIINFMTVEKFLDTITPDTRSNLLKAVKNFRQEGTALVGKEHIPLYSGSKIISVLSKTPGTFDGVEDLVVKDTDELFDMLFIEDSFAGDGDDETICRYAYALSRMMDYNYDVSEEAEELWLGLFTRSRCKHLIRMKQVYDGIPENPYSPSYIHGLVIRSVMTSLARLEPRKALNRYVEKVYI